MRVLILLLICTGLQAQLPTTDLSFRWVGGINPTDSTLIDSITGLPSGAHKLTDVDFNLNLGYMPANSIVKLNGVPITTIFRNIDYLNQEYYEFEAQTLNPDTTENLPYRLVSIAEYSTPQDANSYFNVPPKSTTALEVGAGKPYGTIQPALLAANVGDTIYVYSGTHKDATYSTAFQDVSIIGVGNAIWQSTATNYLLRINAGKCYISNIVLDSESNTTYNTFLLGGYLSAKNVHYLNPTTYNAYKGAAADSMRIQNCVIEGTTTHNIYGSDLIIRENYITGNVTSCVYTLNEVQSYVITEYNIFQPTAVQYVHWKRSDADYFDRFNTYNINVDLTNLVEVRQGGYDGQFNFYSNDINMNYATAAALIRMYTGNNISGDIHGNTFSFGQQGDGDAILLDDVVDVNIYRNVFNATSTGNYAYINLVSTSAGYVGSPHVYENELSIRNITGYGIKVGDEATGIGDNSYNAIIEKNLMKGVLTFNPSEVGVSFHGTFVGFQDDCIIRFNHEEGMGFNSLFKGASSGQYYSNININGSINFRLKGATNIDIYGNSFYSNLPIVSSVVSFTENLGGDPSSGTFNNNIIQTNFNTTTKTLYSIQDNSTISADYNVVYTDSDLYASVNLTGYNWSGWQGLGNDVNSLNLDPLFIDIGLRNFTLQDTSPALKAGIELDVPIYSLVPGSVFPLNVNTRKQTIIDIGAYKMNNYILRYNGKLLLSGNKFIEL